MLLILFSRLFIRLLPLCVLLSVIVPVFGGRQPASDAVWERFGFDYCLLPCFAGITPGDTAFHQAPRLLRQHIPVMENRMFNTGEVINFWAANQSRELAGMVRYELGVVGEIRLNLPLPLDHVIAQLGMPDCILPGTSDNPRRAIMIFWIRDGVSIGAVLSMDQRIFTLSSHVPALWLRAVTPNDCDRSGAVRWQGFAPLWEYRG